MAKFLCLVIVALFVPTLFAVNTPVSHATAHTTHGTQLSTPDSQIGCDICKGVASIIGPLVRSNVSMDVIEYIATGVCELLKIDCTNPDACKDVCVGIIKEHAPEVIQILTDTLLAPAEVCYIITLCPAPTPPPPPRPGIPVPSNCSDHTGEIKWPAWSLHGKGTFLHLSDIHLDLKYTVGTNSECGEPLCCRAVNGPGNATTAAGAWGNYQCDTPLPVLQDLLNYIANMNPQPDFIIYTGDDPAHDVWEQSKDNNLAAVHAIFGAMAQFLPNIPVFPAIGNHEAFPVNQFQGPGGDSWLYDALVVAWAHWLPEDALHTLQYGGYYTARIRPGLRVVAINTNMYITNNFWLYQNHTDISSQLAWLDDVLSQASALKEQVILIGHQFDGTWFDDFSLSYNAIIEKWQSIVLGQFFGHTHTASLGLWYTNSSNIQTPAGVAYIGGSVTTYQDLNPGYNQYGYTRELTNPDVLVETWDMYWSDVTIANAKNQATWNVVGFNAIRDLEMKDLSLTSWQQLGETFRANNASQTVYEAWVNMYVKGAIGINKLPSQVSIGCDILATTKAQKEACEQQYQGYVSVKPKDKC